MDSISTSCNELKKKYDSCFHVWFSERFLKGDMDDSMCADLFKDYKKCLEKAIKDQQIELHEVESNYLGTDKEKKPPS